MLTRTIDRLPPATSLARLAKCWANGESMSERRILAESQRDLPQLARVFNYKTAVPAAHTGDSGWAGALMQSGMWSEILGILRGRSAFDALSAKMRRAPFKTKLPRELTSATIGGVVREGDAAPVLPWLWDVLALDFSKVVALTVLTREILRLEEGTDDVVRDVLINGLSTAVNTAFLDPSHATSITNGVPPVPCTGNTAAAVVTDFGNLIAAITTPGTDLVWLMRPKTAAHLALVLGAAAADLPRSLFGLPAIVTASVPQFIGSPAGALVALVDAAEIVFADAGYELQRSTQATVEMSDAPASDGTTPTATEQVSLFQSNSCAFLQVRYINWLVAREGATAWMAASY